MKPTGFHNWDLFSSAYNNAPNGFGDLPMTGINLVIAILVAAVLIMAGLTLREMSDR